MQYSLYIRLAYIVCMRVLYYIQQVNVNADVNANADADDAEL